VTARFSRDAIMRRLRAERDAGTAIYDALCGSGITAKMAARGGASMVTTHCLAYFRMQGMSSMAGYLPICDANALTLELGERALLSVIGDCPLIAGLLLGRPDTRHAALPGENRRGRL
jgi:predicted TIM-barrel enzyme